MLGLTTTQARRRRRQRQTQTKNRPIAAEQMQRDTTRQDLPRGFQTHGQSELRERSDALGTTLDGTSSSKYRPSLVSQASNASCRSLSIETISSNEVAICAPQLESEDPRDALLWQMGSLLETAMQMNAKLKNTLREKDFCLRLLLSNAPPSSPPPPKPPRKKDVELAFQDYQRLRTEMEDPEVSWSKPWVEPLLPEDVLPDEGYCDYVREAAQAEPQEFYTFPVKPPAAKEQGRLKRFLISASGLNKANKPVTLGMWHNHWQKRDYGKGKLLNESALIPSEAHPNLRWKVSGPLAGNFWTLDEVPTQHPEMGGCSNDPSYGYGPEETRPLKKLEVVHFMDVRGLPYVDLELYIHLKSFTAEAGTVSTTHAKLHRMAKTFMASYRTDHLAPELVLEIKHWTVLAAMIPSQSEMRGLKMMANAELYRQMGKAAQFKRDGKVVEKISWWRLAKPRMLEMYKPTPV